MLPLRMRLLMMTSLLCAAQAIGAQDSATPVDQAPAAPAAVEDAAAPPDEAVAAPEPPEIPEAVQSGQPLDTPLEPEVTIIQREQETVQEYRINGQLYMVKITPSAGKPYYLIDSDGDGSLETRGNDIVAESSVPQWVLFSW